jgi:hypothetical protein
VRKTVQKSFLLSNKLVSQQHSLRYLFTTAHFFSQIFFFATMDATGASAATVPTAAAATASVQQAFDLPKASISRIIKRAIGDASLSAEVKVAFAKAAGTKH